MCADPVRACRCSPAPLTRRPHLPRGCGGVSSEKRKRHGSSTPFHGNQKTRRYTLVYVHVFENQFIGGGGGNTPSSTVPFREQDWGGWGRGNESHRSLYLPGSCPNMSLRRQQQALLRRLHCPRGLTNIINVTSD